MAKASADFADMPFVRFRSNDGSSRFVPTSHVPSAEGCSATGADGGREWKSQVSLLSRRGFSTRIRKRGRIPPAQQNKRRKPAPGWRRNNSKTNSLLPCSTRRTPGCFRCRATALSGVRRVLCHLARCCATQSKTELPRLRPFSRRRHHKPRQKQQHSLLRKPRLRGRKSATAHVIQGLFPSPATPKTMRAQKDAGLVSLRVNDWFCAADTRYRQRPSFFPDTPRPRWRKLR